MSIADQKRVRAVIKEAQRNDGVPRTAQQSIPFDRMFKDGICRIGSDYYTKTIQFQDINYQLAQQEDQTEIFEEWCSFLNFFDSSVHFELSFMNMATDAEKFEKSIAIPHQNDGFNEVRDEYTGMLKRQMEAGNNGLTKTKYLSFGIHAESMKAAKPRLIHIEMDLLNNFKRLGVQANTLNGAERLELIHQQFHMGDDEKFFFDWKWLVGSGLSVKDFVAPAGLNFKNGRLFQMGNLYGAMSFLSITASDISDRMLADFLGMESSQIVTMHVQSVDQTEAIKTVKHTITELDRSKIEEQKKAVRAGYDMDIIPSDLATYGKDAKALLKELQSQNERMFLLTFLVLNTGKTEQELENNVFQANSIAQKHNCNLVRLNFQQEQGLMSSLPLAYNEIEIQRGMTTSSTAIFVPFTTQELFQAGDEALYYGLNALSNNLIMVDRKKLKNPTIVSDVVDMDVAVMIPLNIDENPDPRKIKRYLKESIDIAQRSVTIKEPCVRASYYEDGEEWMHIDLPLYANMDGDVYLARGKDTGTYKWEDADPDGLNESLCNKINGNDQLRRIICFVKKWRDEKYSNSTSDHEVPPSIGLTYLVCDNFVECSSDDGDDDLLALKKTMESRRNAMCSTWN